MYDKESIYDEKISPLMAQIIQICKDNDIQYVAQFLLREKTDDADDWFCTSVSVKNNEHLRGVYNVAINGYIPQKPYFAAVTITKAGETK